MKGGGQTNKQENVPAQEAADQAQEDQIAGGNDQPPEDPPSQQSDAPAVPQAAGDVQVQEAALNNTSRRVTFVPVNNLDILSSMKELEQEVTDLLRNEREKHRGIKWYMALTCEYSKLSVDGERQISEQVFRSRTFAAVSDDDIMEQLAMAMQDIFQHSQEFQAEGSGWSLERVLLLTVHTVAYQPLLGNSYIKLPEFIVKKKAVLNIQNKDDKCILWSILAHLHPVGWGQNAYKVAKYRQYEHELNMAGVAYPTPIKDVRKIESQNDLSINVFGYDDTDGVYPLYITRKVCETHINLLLITDEDKSQYCLIRNFSWFITHRSKKPCKTTFLLQLPACIRTEGHVRQAHPNVFQAEATENCVSRKGETVRHLC